MAGYKGKKIVIGNWKMHKGVEEALTFLRTLESQGPFAVEVGLTPGFVALGACCKEAKRVRIGAQNLYPAKEGAFTGEISAPMIREAGGSFVLVGHSERRLLLDETDEFIGRKVQKAVEYGLTPILCVGETEEERESGLTQETLERQLEVGLAGVDASQVWVAYEPVWAVGTGKSATPQIAEEMHRICRCFVPTSPILYGGSVTEHNAKELVRMPNVDGVLVGGVSLVVERFTDLIRGIR